MDALYQQLNRRSSRIKMEKFVRRAYRDKRTVADLAGRCEDLTLYYFFALRESALDMVSYLLQYHQCDHNALAAMIFSLVSVQDGRRKTLGLGLEDKKVWQPKQKSAATVKARGTKPQKTNRYLF